MSSQLTPFQVFSGGSFLMFLLIEEDVVDWECAEIEATFRAVVDVTYRTIELL